MECACPIKMSKMKKKLLITVVSSVAIALFFAGQKQSSVNVLVSDNVEALSDGDTDFFKVFGRSDKHTLYEYATSSTNWADRKSGYAAQSDEYVGFHPDLDDAFGKKCASQQTIDKTRPRTTYCYTITKVD